MLYKANRDPDSTAYDIQIFPSIRAELSSARLKEYVKGGRGIVTLENPNTQKHLTYQFQEPRNPSDFPDGTLFVYVSIKNKQWAYVGMYNWYGSSFKLTQSSKFRWESSVVKGAVFLARIMRNTNLNYAPMHVYHEGTCSVCGRRLTDPESLRMGMGPHCRKRVEGKRV